MLSRRTRILTVCAAIFATAMLLACSGPEPQSRLIEFATSLQADAEHLAEQKKIIVVFISQRNCAYCELLRQQVLYPMIRHGELDERIELREVSLDAGFELVDFQGQTVAGLRFAERYDAYVTPTLLFLNRDGATLAEPLVGTGNIEFYSFYLQQNIEKAATALVTPLAAS